MPISRFILNSKILYKKLRGFNSIIKTEKIIPALDYAKFSLASGVLTVQVSDMVNTLYVSFEVDSQSIVDTYLLDVKPLLSLLKYKHEQPICFEHHEGYVEIKLSSGALILETGDLMDYPKEPNNVVLKKQEFTCPIFLNRLKSIFAHVSKDDLRPTMTGVNFVLNNEELSLCATNGHILSEYTENVRIKYQYEYSINTILPASTVRIILDSFKEGEEIAVYSSNSHIELCQDGLRLVSRVITDEFPDYKKLFDNVYPTEIVANRWDLIKEIRICNDLADPITRQVKLSIINSSFIVQTDHDMEKTLYGSTGNMTYHANIEADITGHAINLGLNARYFLKVLESLPGSHVRIKIEAANKAVILEPENFLKFQRTLIMPVMLKTSTL